MQGKKKIQSRKLSVSVRKRNVTDVKNFFMKKEKLFLSTKSEGKVYDFF